jgi:hypothetical protein
MKYTPLCKEINLKPAMPNPNFEIGSDCLKFGKVSTLTQEI